MEEQCFEKLAFIIISSKSKQAARKIGVNHEEGIDELIYHELINAFNPNEYSTLRTLEECIDKAIICWQKETARNFKSSVV